MLRPLRWLWLPSALVAIMLISAGCSASAPEAPPILTQLRGAVQAELERMDKGLSEAATGLARTGLTGPEARAVLARLCQAHASAVDCAAVDKAGRMVTIEPAVYRSHEGKDISQQAQVVRLHSTRKPVLSQVFRAVEGFDAADLQWPVLGPGGDLIGSASLLFRPETLLGNIIAPQVKGSNWEPWLMQVDSRVIYDLDPQEIGRVTLTDPLFKAYPEVLELAVHISHSPSGAGSYKFLRAGFAEATTKRAWWTTVGLHGTEWRLVISQEVR